LNAPLLEVSELVVQFDRGRSRPPLRAVDSVSFNIDPGETLGLVGESGSGKTTIARAILGLTSVTEGTIRFRGEDITTLGRAERRRLSADLQVVFQDPYSSLNPTRTIGQTLAETLRPQGVNRAKAASRASEMLERVELPPDAAGRYPTHFSGGQRQRIAIARALMAEPRLVICDEPTSALDLSVQASVLNLLRELQRDLDLSYLFIAHDLAVVRHVSHRIAVLYHGRVMEQGAAAEVYGRPIHPYTQALLTAAPVPDPDEQRKRRLARGARASLPIVPSASSCPFAPRCPYVIHICRTSRPPLESTRDGTLVACHRWHEIHRPVPTPTPAWEDSV
jgi:peptide/nickel transport system ATP-binding protein